MTITDIIGLIVIITLLSLILYFSFRNKKVKGKCHGCPYLKQCSKNNTSCNSNKIKKEGN